LRKNTQRRSLNPFYGYPAELIAEWCCVSVQSAEHYKAGRRKPSNRVLKLFRLQRDGKVLGDAWDDYRVIDERLFGPDGKSIRPTDIALWELVWQIAAEADRERYHALLDSLQRA
jgi:hypothetical protein